MKTLIAVLLLFSGLAFSSQSSGPGSHSVRSYTTSRGTNVPAHRATNRDGTQANNWTAKGNVNPNTGKAGTKPVTH